MNNKLSLILLILFSLCFILVSAAEAKRFGGGYSFGGKKSYSSPYQQQSGQNRTFTRQQSTSQQKAAASNQQRRQQLASRGGLMGILGGLALGGLLGALFFGGAFEGFNFFDLIVIGGVLLLFMWLMKRKVPGADNQATATAGAYDMNKQSATASRSEPGVLTENQYRLETDQRDADFSEHFDPDSNSAGPASSSAKESSFADSFGVDYGHAHNRPMSDSANEIILPEWFNQDEFLSGARSAYTMLQEAWDNGDLTTIENLTTDSVFREISRQFEEQPSQGPTRIVQLNAELIDFQQLEQQTETAVLFDALLAETDDFGHQGRTAQVKELWHFIRVKDSTEPTWYLDGIQQLE